MFNNIDNLCAVNFSVLWSIKCSFYNWYTSVNGDSICSSLESSNFLKKTISFLNTGKKWSAFLIFPGTASFDRSFASIGWAITSCSLESTFYADNFLTSFSYSYLRREAPVSFSSWIRSSSFRRFCPARSSDLRLKFILNASIHALSMLWHSSNTTMQSFYSSLETRLAIFGSSM